MDIKIEELSVEGIPVIQGIADRTFMLTYRGIHSEEQNSYMMGLMYSTESLTEQMTGKGSRFILISVDGTPCGFCAFKPFSGNEHGEGAEGSTSDPVPVIYLDKLYVLPECQGMGLGKKLVEQVISESRRQHPGGCIIRLDVNQANAAKAFYEHLGFVGKRLWDAPIGQGFYMNGCTMDLTVRCKE